MGSVRSPILTDISGTKFRVYLLFRIGTKLCLSFQGTNKVRPFEDNSENKFSECGFQCVSLETSARSFFKHGNYISGSIEVG
jgi:hypothetical protein